MPLRLKIYGRTGVRARSWVQKESCYQETKKMHIHRDVQNSCRQTD